jgi:hypothetical protein
MVPPLKNEEGGRGDNIMVKLPKHFQVKLRLFSKSKQNLYEPEVDFHLKYEGFFFA